jgi:hypothetical protein
MISNALLNKDVMLASISFYTFININVRLVEGILRSVKTLFHRHNSTRKTTEFLVLT